MSKIRQDPHKKGKPIFLMEKPYICIVCLLIFDKFEIKGNAVLGFIMGE